MLSQVALADTCTLMHLFDTDYFINGQSSLAVKTAGFLGGGKEYGLF